MKTQKKFKLRSRIGESKIGMTILLLVTLFSGSFCAGLVSDKAFLAYAAYTEAAQSDEDNAFPSNAGNLLDDIKAHRDFFAALDNKKDLFALSLADYANHKILGINTITEDNVGVVFLDPHGMQETAVFHVPSGKVIRREFVILKKETRLAMRNIGVPVTDAYFLALNTSPPEKLEAKPVMLASVKVPNSENGFEKKAAEAVSVPERSISPLPAEKSFLMPELPELEKMSSREVVEHFRKETGWVTKVARQKQAEKQAKKHTKYASLPEISVKANLDVAEPPEQSKNDKISLRFTAEKTEKKDTPDTPVSAPLDNPSSNGELVKKIVAHREFFAKINGADFFMNSGASGKYRVYDVKEQAVKGCVAVVFLAPSGELETIVFDECKNLALYRDLGFIGKSKQAAIRKNSIGIDEAGFIARNIAGVSTNKTIPLVAKAK